jgi:hypothetical protein
MPVHLMRRILDRARGLQDQLTASGESSPELKRTEEVALNELTMTYLRRAMPRRRSMLPSAPSR